MDASLIAVSMHSFERIVAVLLGGLAVYYGFRLFLVLPIETQSDGKIRLPGMSVVLAKAGPGLFFAAFGALVILTSLVRPVKVVTSDVDYSGVTPAVPLAAASRQAAPQGTRPGAEQDVARVRLAVQSINCMQRLANAGAKKLPTGDLDQAAREAKLALLANAWDAKAWGDFKAFKDWATGRTAVTASPAKALFESERADCPR